MVVFLIEPNGRTLAFLWMFYPRSNAQAFDERVSQSGRVPDWRRADKSFDGLVQTFLNPCPHN